MLRSKIFTLNLVRYEHQHFGVQHYMSTQGSPGWTSWVTGSNSGAKEQVPEAVTYLPREARLRTAQN